MIELTKDEKAWIRRAKKLFKECPNRFDFYTIGDPDLTIIERGKLGMMDLMDHGDGIEEIQIDHINTGGRVHGLAG